MSSRDGNQELHGDGDGDDDAQRSDDAAKTDGDKLGAKDAVVARIKHNFYLETQAFRKRILDATGEASRARERVDSFQEETLRVKKKCFKLKKLLAERDATIQFLHEQQEVSFPIMMSETMRNIHAHMGDDNDNQQQQQQQQDDDLNQAPFSISRMREQAQDRAAVDDRIHEYETQIAQLYTEIQDEKQKNEMLSECLREQKHTKGKLMKACKHAKQEIAALKNNGMKQLLEDMQSKCQGLEAENERLGRELAEEKLKVQDSHDRVARELVLLREAESNWEDMVRSKDDELAKFREQIRAQQMLIENMEFDMRSKRRTRRSSFEGQDDNEHSEDAREERELLTRALQTERSRLKGAEQEINELRVKTEALERSLHANQSCFTPTNSRGYARGGASRTDTGENLGDLLKMAQQLRTKVSVLHQLLRSYVETASIDMQLLAGEIWREDGAFADPDAVSHLTTVENCETRLRLELLHAKRSLSELQQMVEDACATAMGSSCALQ